MNPIPSGRSGWEGLVMLLEDHVCIVCGAGPGLGRQIALQAARHGATVVLAARRQGVLEDLADEVSAAGGRALAVPTDLTDAAQCERLARTTVEEFGRIDSLVNNVFAADQFKTFRRADLDDWRQLVEVNLFAPLQVTQAAVPHMQERRRGSIVFVNSMVVRKPRAQEGGYTVAKGGLFTAARLLALELGRHGIRVNSVLPGWMWGPQVEQHVAFLAEHRGTTSQAVVEEIASAIPLGTIPTDEEVAGVVVFLLSDLASAVTGQSIDVNGGEVFA
jgi:NAD(P)-dependent dehydrogenase (short-subunit alcohol dehydrogenase family)